MLLAPMTQVVKDVLKGKCTLTVLIIHQTSGKNQCCLNMMSMGYSDSTCGWDGGMLASLVPWGARRPAAVCTHVHKWKFNLNTYLSLPLQCSSHAYTHTHAQGVHSMCTCTYAKSHTPLRTTILTPVHTYMHLHTHASMYLTCIRCIRSHDRCRLNPSLIMWSAEVKKIYLNVPHYAECSQAEKQVKESLTPSCIGVLTTWVTWKSWPVNSHNT